ncbi:hypothetical protein FOL47_006646 [Perkinsus chesapeaki]|uniref:C3H1-type domain-containing protein n=1 Tax=Perkinsus chesapeaki TaxID=330153 RepID=A0A7J6LRG9_PERCH|nr:hypothetical protein FOL47_006646 [Perkinsus chesapeaki]
MPPKATKQDRGADKAKMKARERVAEDKTFGLKNKNKSHKVQRYVQEVQAAAKAKPGQRGPQKNEFEKREEKKKEEQRQFLLQSIFSGVQLETKKDKKKAAKQKKKEEEEKYGKIDLYSDNRNKSESEEEKKQDTMDHWDQAKLEQVIKTKHNATNQNKPTEIICKYFLDAVEKGVYGWFWVCPNGGDKCKYRHALPPGYVLKKKKTDDDEDDYDNGPSIDEIIEQERQALPAGGTPVTLETFTAWKKKKQEEREADEERKKQERIAQAKKEKRSVMSGRDLFAFDPTLFKDEDDESSDSSDDEEEEDNTEVDTPQHVLQSSGAAALFSKDEELPDDD